MGSYGSEYIRSRPNASRHPLLPLLHYPATAPRVCRSGSKSSIATRNVANPGQTVKSATTDRKGPTPLPPAASTPRPAR
jgi:hypothetical protein